MEGAKICRATREHHPLWRCSLQGGEEATRQQRPKPPETEAVLKNICIENMQSQNKWV